VAGVFVKKSGNGDVCLDVLLLIFAGHAVRGESGWRIS
jgi:hypothetical protein